MADDMSHRAPDARRMSFDEMAARAQYEWDRAEWAEAEARDMADRLEAAQSRVRELEAEVDALRHDLERQMTIANVECNRAETAEARLSTIEAETIERCAKVAYIQAKQGATAEQVAAAIRKLAQEES